MRLPSSDFNSAANASIADARQAADHLAAIMKRIHGGEWVIHVDHVTEFVLVNSVPDRAGNVSLSRRAV